MTYTCLQLSNSFGILDLVISDLFLNRLSSVEMLLFSATKAKAHILNGGWTF